MRGSLVVVALFVAAGVVFAAESSGHQATKAQPADDIIVLTVEGMT